MTTVPLPNPRPFPWPSPAPGQGTPHPSPGPIVTTPPVVTMPGPTASTGSITGPFADLFKFSPDWKFWGALVLVALSVEFVDQTYPEYVWMYVGILLLGLILKLAGFTPQLDKWLGRL